MIIIVFARASEMVSGRIESIGFTDEELKEVPMNISVEMKRKGSRVA